MGKETLNQTSSQVPTEVISLLLSRECTAALVEIARRRGLPIPEAFKETLGTTLFLDREVADGAEIILVRKGRFGRRKYRQLLI